MPEKRNKDENILLNKISFKNGFSIEECTPILEKFEGDLRLVWDASGNITWKPDEEFNIRLNNNITEDHSIHFDQSRIGIGRKPLHDYKIDLGVPVNTKTTAFHIGDGTFGFSMGNGSNQGFIPEIVGMGSDEEDPGLYLLGKSSSSLPSKVPLVIVDGRNVDNTPLSCRPIFGVTNGDYSNFKLLVHNNGDITCDGIIEANDVLIDGVSINDLKNEIEELKKQIIEIKKLIK